MQKTTTYIKSLLLRHQNFVRYIISGGTAAVVEYLLFNLLFYIVIKEVLIVSQIISYSAGLLTAFLLHHFWTFKTNGKHKHSSRKQFIMYSTVSITNLVISSFVLVQLKNFGFYPWLAKIIVMGMVVLWNFFIMNKIIFGSDNGNE
ncbi:MAG: GtrA family protein [Candidatus Saccharibacteria bacterium]|nr:GtrA family protein [Candidatus Saccharibacteria bacterium]